MTDDDQLRQGLLAAAAKLRAARAELMSGDDDWRRRLDALLSEAIAELEVAQTASEGQGED